MKGQYLIISFAAMLLIVGCESREKRIEREMRENVAIMQKIADSLKTSSDNAQLLQNDSLLATAITAYAKTAYAYFLEKGKFSCEKGTIGFVLVYSKSFPISYSCYEKNGTASFSIIGDLGSCSGSTIDVKPVIANNDMKYDYKFDSDKCSKILLPIINGRWSNQ